MPAQKCVASKNLDDAEPMEPPTKQSRHGAQPTKDDEKKPELENNDVQRVKAKDDEGSDGSSLMGSEEKPEYVYIELPDIRNDFQCPICLGIIKKTRTVMECLHRFCRECIDKSMRLGNKECPTCRTHCPSRRSLRDDPNYDALISAIYRDIDKYGDEESAFHEEDMARNKQFQVSIAQISKRQSEAMGKGRTQDKNSAGATITRPRRNTHNTYLRRWNSHSIELQGYEYREYENDDSGGKYSSSSNEHTQEVVKRKYKRRWKSTKPSEASSSAANADDACTESDTKARTQGRRISPILLWNPDKVTWGKGGARSNPRQGSTNGCSSKYSRSNHLLKLVDYCLSSEDNNDEVSLQAEEGEIEETCHNPSNQCTINHQTKS